MANNPELEQWMREAGSLRVVDEGEQFDLFTHAAVRMYRLLSATGESRMVSAETAHGYGLRPRPMKKAKPQSTPDLFNDTRELF
jgi:molecular chaperone GrpE (heat shock protein)